MRTFNDGSGGRPLLTVGLTVGLLISGAAGCRGHVTAEVAPLDAAVPGDAAVPDAPPADAPPEKPPIASRWSLEPIIWEDNTNTRVSTEALVQGYLDRKIPFGAVLIDSPWETAYNTLLWDETRYPQPQEMIDAFHAKGIKVMLWLTALINVGTPDFDMVKTQGYGVNEGQSLKWWKGNGIHIDYTNAAAAGWWHAKLDAVMAMGIDGWKVDDGADMVTDPVRTAVGSMSRMDFKMGYATDFHDRVINQNPNSIIMVRPYSHQTGFDSPVSKCIVGWVGDWEGDFSGLAGQLNDVYISAENGYGAIGMEVGGYLKPKPTKRSLIRAAQAGAFTPLMENGGSNGGEAEHLPWFWDDETTDIYRRFATVHSELVPYVFSYSVESHLVGGPILRNVDRTKIHHLLGKEIFVSPIVADTTEKTVEFPAGGKWIDFWDEQTTYDGGATVTYTAALDRYPAFVKAGAIIPMNVKTAVAGHGDETSARKTTIMVFPYGSSDFVFHQPTGEGTTYADSTIRVIEKKGTDGPATITITGVMDQAYRLRVKTFTAPTAVTGADTWSYDDVAHVVTIDKQGARAEITITGLQGFGGPVTP